MWKAPRGYYKGDNVASLDVRVVNGRKSRFLVGRKAASRDDNI